MPFSAKTIKKFENNTSLQREGMFGSGKINSQHKKCTEIFIEGNLAEEVFQTFGKYLISFRFKF